jgi:hypothetical protein
MSLSTNSSFFFFAILALTPLACMPNREISGTQQSPNSASQPQPSPTITALRNDIGAVATGKAQKENSAIVVAIKIVQTIISF